MGKEKLHFALLELAECQKGQLEQSVSTIIVSDVVNNSQMHDSLHSFC